MNWIHKRNDLHLLQLHTCIRTKIFFKRFFLLWRLDPLMLLQAKMYMIYRAIDAAVLSVDSRWSAVQNMFCYDLMFSLGLDCCRYFVTGKDTFNWATRVWLSSWLPFPIVKCRCHHTIASPYVSLQWSTAFQYCIAVI